MKFRERLCKVTWLERVSGDYLAVANSASTNTLRLDVQNPTAVLAMDRIGIVNQEATILALKAYLVRSEDYLKKAQEKAHSCDHNHNCEQPSGWT
jgi:hypothetical protein